MSESQMLILPKKYSSLFGTGNLTMLFSPKKLDVMTDTVYIASENNLYGLVKLSNELKCSKENLKGYLDKIKMNLSEYENNETSEFYLYEIQMLERYVPTLCVQYPKVGNYDLVNDYKILDYNAKNEFNSEEYTDNYVKVNVSNNNIKDIVSFVNEFLLTRTESLNDYILQMSLVPSKLFVSELKDYTNETKLSSTATMLFIPRGINVKIMKSGNVVRVISEELGDITNKIPTIIRELTHIPYNIFKADAILSIDGKSRMTTIKLFGGDYQIDGCKLYYYDLEYADGSVNNENPMSRLNMLKPCAIGFANSFISKGMGVENNTSVNDLSEINSKDFVIVLDNNYNSGDKYYKDCGIETELSVNDVIYDGKYHVYTDLGDLITDEPVVKSSKVVVLVGENVFELIDSGIYRDKDE